MVVWVVLFFAAVGYSGTSEAANWWSGIYRSGVVRPRGEVREVRLADSPSQHLTTVHTSADLARVSLRHDAAVVANFTNSATNSMTVYGTVNVIEWAAMLLPYMKAGMTIVNVLQLADFLGDLFWDPSSGTWKRESGASGPSPISPIRECSNASTQAGCEAWAVASQASGHCPDENDVPPACSEYRVVSFNTNGQCYCGSAYWSSYSGRCIGTSTAGPWYCNAPDTVINGCPDGYNLIEGQCWLDDSPEDISDEELAEEIARMLRGRGLPQSIDAAKDTPYAPPIQEPDPMVEPQPDPVTSGQPAPWVEERTGPEPGETWKRETWPKVNPRPTGGADVTVVTRVEHCVNNSCNTTIIEEKGDSEAVDVCALHPEASACKPLGDPGPPDAIPQKDVQLTFPKELTAAGSCPSPITFQFFDRTYELSWEPICRVAIETRPVFLSIVVATLALTLATWTMRT